MAKGAPTLETRASGLLLHLSSLPGPHGNGDLGAEAHAFAGHLAEAGQRWWQMLPIHPVGAGNSPYTSLSALAGNPLFISLPTLAAEGLLREQELRPARALRADQVDYAAARAYRRRRLRRAYERFREARGGPLRRAYEAFCAAQAGWLEDFALYMALHRAHGNRPWPRWPAPLRDRKPAALEQARERLAEDVDYHRFLQFLFDRQWNALRKTCGARGVGLIGDLPIFVSLDSADVWAHRDLFYLDARGRPTVVAGVPPDYFSEDGQRWGNPLYRWDVLKARDYAWWNERVQGVLRRFDVVRIDHFIGFQRYWEVPAQARTAKRGRFRPGPRDDFFRHLRERLGGLPFIAEDLGLVTPEVTALRQRFGLPGMQVLQFAFGDGSADNSHLPHHSTPGCVVYTGTHDNDTTVGWYTALTRAAKQGNATARTERDHLLRYLGPEDEPVHWALIRLALRTVANTAIVPMQDVLGLGSAARMNRPGTARGNWTWRMAPEAFTPALRARLAELSTLYGRSNPEGQLSQH